MTANEQKDINIMIAEDQNLLAKLMMVNLSDEHGFNIVAIARDGKETLELLEKFETDVLLLDINMPAIDGIQVLKTIRQTHSELKVIMLSSMYEGWMIKNAIANGANGYVSKDANYDEVKKAILTVMHGETYFCKHSFQNFISSVAHDEPAPRKKYPLKAATQVHFAGEGNEGERFKVNYQALTDREKEILRLIVDEKTSKEISESLFISTRTVETHRKNILQKMGVKNSMKLIRLALETNFSEFADGQTV